MSRSSEGHDVYKFCRPQFLDASAKFQNDRPPGSEEDDFFIYFHGGHLGHVTMTIYANFHSLFLSMLRIKFGFDWPSCFREDVRIFWSYTCISPRGRGRQLPGPKILS